MILDSTIIGAAQAWRDWAGTPAGRQALDWELARFDAAVSDAFGYFALQCGPVPVDCLRESRIRDRIHVGTPDEVASPGLSRASRVRVSSLEELPFAAQSLDLVALPHALECAADPHAVLREADRVLRPEGRLLIAGFNPISLWGARPSFLPRGGRPIGAPRLRDWLRLLGFEVDRTSYGCYRPPFDRDEWFARSAFMERAGDRWWPICGAAYFMAAVKRVRGMRLVGPAGRRAATAASEPVALASRSCGAGVSGTCNRGSSAAD